MHNVETETKTALEKKDKRIQICAIIQLCETLMETLNLKGHLSL